MPTRILTLAELQERFESLAGVAGTKVTIGVRDPEVAAYARALEYGSIAGQLPWSAPGPRTTLAVDPETGHQVVKSAQAPQGFVRLQAPTFPAVVARELGSSADWLDVQVLQSHIVKVLRQSAETALERLRAAAPRDSGRLAESLEVLSD